MQVFLLRKIETVDGILQPRTIRNVGFYTLIALACLCVNGIVSPSLAKAMPTMVTIELTGIDAILYSVLMAVSEEQFFRGAITNFLLSMFPAPMAIMGSSAIFTAYHLAVYGTEIASMIYVFIGGLVLTWVAWRSERLSPSILAHCCNNILSFLW